MGIEGRIPGQSSGSVAPAGRLDRPALYTDFLADSAPPLDKDWHP
jgi:hypothetical protein